MLDAMRGFVFVACELFVLLLLFSPFLLATDESGTVSFKPFGARWVVFGLSWCALVAGALFAPI
jgi:hypothetical protein